MDHKPTFTTILHDRRKALGLTLNEYCIADSIDKLSNTAKYQWCETSREEIGAFIGISKRAVITIIKKLEALGLVEINPNTGKTRTTHKWTISVNLSGEETSPMVQKGILSGEETSPEPVKNVHQSGEETSPNINNIYNNKYNKREEKTYPSVYILENLPQDDLEEFYNTYTASKKQIKVKALELKHYYLKEGKSCSNYREALLSALLKDFGLKPVQVKPFAPDLPQEQMSTEGLEKLRKTIRELPISKKSKIGFDSSQGQGGRTVLFP